MAESWTVDPPVALHPERGADEATILWQVAGPDLHGLDPAALTPWVDAGVLSAVTVAPRHVSTTLAAGRSWGAEATQVRAAVVAAVAAARRADALDPDAALARAAVLVLEEIAPYVAGHGGSITVAAVHEGIVEIEMHGACHGCPAAAFTVQGRVARRLAEVAPQLVAVRVGSQDGPGWLRSLRGDDGDGRDTSTSPHAANDPNPRG